MRGRLLMGGVTGRWPVGAVLDAIVVVALDTPGEALRKWRAGLDRAVIAAQARSGRAPDRASWGLTPEQQAATRRFMATMGGV